MRKVTAIRHRADLSPEDSRNAIGRVTLAHDARHLRRKAVELTDGSRIYFDLPQAVVLNSGDALVLEDGAVVLIEAADEALYAITASSRDGLSALAWHIGNRHLAAEISPKRILILRDPVIKTMLEGLGAEVTEIVAAFHPLRGAYSGHSGQHDHSHTDGHSHAHAGSHSHPHQHQHQHEHAATKLR